METFVLSTHALMFSSAAFLFPGHAVPLSPSKYFPKGNGPATEADIGFFLVFQLQLTWLNLEHPTSLHILPAFTE